MKPGDHFGRRDRLRKGWLGTTTIALGIVACGGSNNDDLLSHTQGGTGAGSSASGGMTGGASVPTGGSSPSGGNAAGVGPAAGASGDGGGDTAEGGAGTKGGSGGTGGSGAMAGSGGVGGPASGGSSATGGKGSGGTGAVNGGVGGTASGGTAGGAGGKATGGTSGATAGGKSGGGGAGGASGGGANAGAAGAATCSGKCDVNAECQVSGNTASCVCKEGYVGNGRSCARPISCRELHEATPGLASGAYTLRPSGGNNEFNAYCEMSAEGGGWTLVLNEGPSFSPSTQGSNVQCFRQDCTSLAYSTVPIVSDVMLDVRDGAIVGSNYLARVIVTGVAAGTRNHTVRELFGDGPHYLEKEDNSNVVVRLNGSGTCADSLPSDFAALVCTSCPAGGNCSAPVLTFGDTDPGCIDDVDYAFAIGASDSYTEAWGNCAGWPQTPDIGDFNYYPDNFRVWVR